MNWVNVLGYYISNPPGKKLNYVYDKLGLSVCRKLKSLSLFWTYGPALLYFNYFFLLLLWTGIYRS